MAAILAQMTGRFDLCEGLVRELRHAAEAHFRAEAETIYPALREIPGFAELVAQAIAQHAAILRLIEQLAAADEPAWPGHIAALHDMLQAYVEEEEDKIIDCGRHQLPAHAVEHLKHRFIAEKKAVLEQGAA